MKKYFLFDDEPIKGMTYFLRFMLCTVLVAFIVGIPLMSSTAYKRAGAFGWSQEMRILCAIVMPVYVIINLFADFLEFSSPTFLIISVLMMILHLTLLFKNGNKSLN